MMSIEKYGCYEFLVCADKFGRFHYEIYTKGRKPYDNGLIESKDWFYTKQEARYAAIGHISLIENNEG